MLTSAVLSRAHSAAIIETLTGLTAAPVLFFVGAIMVKNRAADFMRRYSLADDRPNEETSIERLMRDALTLAGLDFDAQAHVGRYRPDFLLRAWGVVIECDGPVHLTLRQQVKDRHKDAVYAAAGLAVYRFTDRDIRQSAVGCVERIVRERAHAGD